MELDSLVNDVKSQLMIASLMMSVANMVLVKIWSISLNVNVNRVITAPDVINQIVMHRCAKTTVLAPN